MQRGRCVAAAAGFRSARAEEAQLWFQPGARDDEILTGLFDAGRRDAQVGVVLERLADERIERRIVERLQPIVLYAFGRCAAGLPGLGVGIRLPVPADRLASELQLLAAA